MHKPVLIKEVLEYLNPQKGENFVDCTFGFGGHSLAILKKNKPNGKVLGIDFEKSSLEEDRLILVNGNFADLKKIVEKNDFYPINGILLDLGLSSWHFDKSNRGFSFKGEEPLDMRLNSESELTAEEIINEWSEEELIRIFEEYGEERYSKSIAKSICRNRTTKKIGNTSQLREIIRQSIPGGYKHNRINFATKIFQAIRIAVNDELNNLIKTLPQALSLLKPKGRLVVISFHSLEDRIVKNFFKDEFKKGNLEILTKKPIIPSKEEIIFNPRSRSAKLRVIKKI
ncbi:16S rRNA (cytosine(1402)-N(4))-methyltransferase RsmH [Patescibacteria group bacterium]|nr:16S rRNA (cytosine(1402)-N(4))-methyltransferase RsmH [Patescibacteria group bacterium]